MATPVTYSLKFVSPTRTYSISGYTADTAAYANRFSVSGVAGAATSEYFKLPEAATLTDFSMTTGTTQTAMILTESGAPKNGTLLMFLPHLSTVIRPVINIPFAAGAMIGAQTI